MPRRRVEPGSKRADFGVPSLIKNPTVGWRFWQDYWWGKREPRNPQPTRIIREIGEAMMTGPDRLCILAPRGAGKSYNARCAIEYAWLQDVETRVIYMTAKFDHSRKFAGALFHDLHDLSLLQHLKPGAMQKKAKVAFDVNGCMPSHHPSFLALSAESHNQGPHANFILIDDGETAENVRTSHLRSVNEERFADIENLADTGRPTRIIWIGTPQHEETWYKKLLQQMGYTVLAYPIAYPTKDQMPRISMWLAPSLAEDLEKDPSLHNSKWDRCGKPVDPALFPEEKIDSRMKRTMRVNFLQQSMMIPSIADEDALPLKCSNLLVMDLGPDQAPQKVVWSSEPATWDNDLPSPGFGKDLFHKPLEIGPSAPYDNIVMALDTAGEGQDEFAYAIVGSLWSTFYLLDAGGFHTGYQDETLYTLAELCVRWRVKVIYEETGKDGPRVRNVLLPILNKVTQDPKICARHLAPCPWYVGFDEEGYHRRASKEMTIGQILEPLFSQHRIVVNRQLVLKDNAFLRPKCDEVESRVYRLFYQLTRFAPTIPDCLDHDDRLDAFAMACDFFAEKAAIDADKAMKRRAQHEQKVEWQRLLRSTIPVSLTGQSVERSNANPNYFSNNRIFRPRNPFEN